MKRRLKINKNNISKPFFFLHWKSIFQFSFRFFSPPASRTSNESYFLRHPQKPSQPIHTILMEIYSACTFCRVFFFCFYFSLPIIRREESFFNSHKHTHGDFPRCFFPTHPSCVEVASSLFLCVSSCCFFFSGRF